MMSKQRPNGAHQQQGWVGKLFLWTFAVIGFVTVLVLGTITWLEGSAEPIASPTVSNRASGLTAGSKAVTLTPTLQAQFDRSCNICHGQGGTGAPLVGDTAAWQPRLDQGSKLLMQHTIEGHGGMPPMGMCMECSDTEFKAFIEYMAKAELTEECE